MIRQFSCDNFRNISCEDIKFDRINILIGPNNAGKSNFIRALSFAANMVNKRSDETTGFLAEIKRNGWHTAIHRQKSDRPFGLIWTLDLENSPVRYTLRANVSKNREGNRIVEESLDSVKVQDGATEPFNFFNCHKKTIGKGQFSTAGLTNSRNSLLHAKVNPQESVLMQMDDLFFENVKMFSEKFVRIQIRDVLDSMRKYFRGFYSYSCTAFNIAEIREMQDLQNDGSFLKKDGSNFVNVFYDMMYKDADFKNRYLKMLRMLISDCEDIDVPDFGGKVWMELKMNGNSFPLSEVSDGTIHLLILVMLLNMSEHCGISMLAIDEPEMNLHPAWQKRLAFDLQNCRSFKQCFVSTHSPDFLDEFTEGFLSGDVGVFVFDQTSRSPIRKLERSELEDDLQNWTLGDLYRVGDPAIGGWPQ